MTDSDPRHILRQIYTTVTRQTRWEVGRAEQISEEILSEFVSSLFANCRLEPEPYFAYFLHAYRIPCHAAVSLCFIRRIRDCVGCSVDDMVEEKGKWHRCL